MRRINGRAGGARARDLVAGLVAGGSLLGCSANDTSSQAPASQQTQSSACSEPPGQVNAPRTVLEVVELLNAMPKPVTLPCFVESLTRPLALHASTSDFSAQPASGARSPRMFLFSDPLIMTVVPEGMGSHLLEFGEQRPENRSLKAEIEFPVERELQLDEPFNRVMYNDTVTDCSFCHAAEAPDPSIDVAQAFVSQAFRPLVYLRVGLDQLSQEALACDAVVEPKRCALLNAAFDWGEVVDYDFPETMATFP